MPPTPDGSQRMTPPTQTPPDHYITGGAVAGPTNRSAQLWARCCCGWGPTIYVTTRQFDAGVIAHIRTAKNGGQPAARMADNPQ